MTRRMDKREGGLLERPHVLAGCAIALPWLWLCWRYWGYYPLWDAAIYYECTLSAAKTSLNPLAYNVAGHPTMGYLWLPGVLMRYLGGSYRVILVYNAVLGWWMSVAVADMARRLLRGERRMLDLCLIAGSVMYCPVVVASILQLTPDYGVLVFLTLAARAFMHERLVRAIGWGILAGLSKESGALLFVVEVAAYYVIFSLRAPRLAAEKVLAVYRRLPLILIPLAGLLAGAVYVGTKGAAGLWRQADLLSVVRQFSTVSFLDNVLPASLATIFVLNCMWIPALILLVYFAWWFLRSVVLVRYREGARDPAFEFAVTVFVVEVFLLTRFRTFTNVRYYLPVFPWIILLAGRGLVDLHLPRLARIAGQGGVLAAVGLSNFRSFDPVSADVFGTMPFGEHRLFRITSLTGECCGLGRDQLVYNLEFAEIDRLLREVLPFVLAAEDRHTVAIHPEADWKLFDSVSPRTFRRTTPSVGTFKVPYTHTWAVGAAPIKPEKIYYIALPNMANTNELVRYGAWYDFNWRRRRFEHDGYRIDVHELKRKQ
jgi:hypothetical protein